MPNRSHARPTVMPAGARPAQGRGLAGVLASLGVAMVLGGCATAPVVPTTVSPEAWPQRRAQLQALAHFRLKGRVAVAAGEEGFNASLRWQQEGGRTQLSLEGPLGAGGVYISAQGDDLQIVTAHGEQYSSDAAHAALKARLGFDPPLASLRFWVLGVPDPAQAAEETMDVQPRLKVLQQTGWRIEYTAYMAAPGVAAAAGAASVLPSRLTLRRDNVRVKLLVDDWQP
ncbi:MAG: outer membrane lipoprotein LolB [Proteobacteria bacterium]|nr:outer membrane lipoprotein LolB [Pseudomonadota bacterium]